MPFRETPAIDPAEIERATRLLFPPGVVTEVRIPKTRAGVISGYFDNPASLVTAIREVDARYSPAGIYCVLNPVVPALIGRAYNRLRERSEHTTADSNIARRRWLPVDLDPVRPAGISSSDEEHEAALARARTIADEMSGEWGRPIVADSGNGAHLVYPIYPIDLPNDEESLRMVTGALAMLDQRYSDAIVKVDVTCANAARIWKVYGTVARKGDSIPGRPHRISRVLEVPDGKS